MSTATAKRPVEKFHRPAARSMLVDWYRDANPSTQPCPAVVVEYQPNNSTVSLVVFHHHVQISHTATGVRHRDDPVHEERPAHAKDNGVWDYSPDDYMAPIRRRFDTPEAFAQAFDALMGMAKKKSD